jgi:hypothetical protein
MNNIDKYNAHARHCMDMAARAQHADDKRSWLLLAETWLEMIPEFQRTAADRRPLMSAPMAEIGG